MFLIICIGGLYLVIGLISLFTALLFIELGRPKDLIQSGILILLGTFLIIYKNIFPFNISLIVTLNAALIILYFIENYSYRWNQLLDKEKFDIKSFSGFKKNFSIIYKIISLDLKNIFKNTSIKKKWVRKKDNNNLSNQEASSKQYMSKVQTPDSSKRDIINVEKINLENKKIDK